MQLTKQEQKMLEGAEGYAVRKSMEILVALGEIYGAKSLIAVGSVQVAGVSYNNLGDAGLEFLDELAKDGKVRVLTTLNPAGMDLENWRQLGISPEFAEKQNLVIKAFEKMGILVSCTCTPYLIGNLPLYGEHIAWSESSAVTFANSVIGAKTNKEGGPSALAAAFVGKTPCYGLHLDENRVPDVHVEVKAELAKLSDWGALGYAIGKKAENKIPFITGIKEADLDELKSFCASVVTYGAKPLFYIKGITPASEQQKMPNTNGNNRASRHQKRLRQHQRPSNRHRTCLRRLPTLLNQRNRQSRRVGRRQKSCGGHRVLGSNFTKRKAACGQTGLHGGY